MEAQAVPWRMEKTSVMSETCNDPSLGAAATRSSQKSQKWSQSKLMFQTIMFSAPFSLKLGSTFGMEKY
jgi:hypothetical protein